MTEMAGATVQDSWETLTRVEQLAIAREIGTITAAIHSLPEEDLAEVEQQFGGRREYAQQMQAERIAQIEASERLSTRQREAILHYLVGEAQNFLDEPPKVTHSDFSHAHIYLVRETDTVKVAGLIDWAEAMLGPPEWDIAFIGSGPSRKIAKPCAHVWKHSIQTGSCRTASPAAASARIFTPFQWGNFGPILQKEGMHPTQACGK